MKIKRNVLYSFDSYTVEVAERRLWRDKELVPLTPKAFDTLVVLLEYKGRIVEKDVLLNEVWQNTFVEESTLAQNISTLRKALGTLPSGAQFIETIPRHGYRFIADVKEVIGDEEIMVVEHRMRTQICAEHETILDEPVVATEMSLDKPPQRISLIQTKGEYATSEKRGIMVIHTLIIEDEPLARQTLWEFTADIEWLAVVGEAADGRTAVNLIDSLRPDLVFLDVQMPEMSGLEILRSVKHQPAVIFTTAFDKYAVTAFEFEALDYLLKPFGRSRFQTAINRAHRLLKKEKMEKTEAQKKLSTQPVAAREPLTRLFVRSRNAVIPLKIDDVSRFEADDDYVRVYTENRFYLINLTLNEIEARLDSSRFCRIHRSLIINLEFVERVETQDRRLLLILKDKTELLASRSGSQLLRKLIL